MKKNKGRGDTTIMELGGNNNQLNDSTYFD
jgi:hypothetical protein